MNTLGYGALAIIVVLAASSAASAGECQHLSAAGDGLTKDIAVVMSTHGLANIIEGKGLRPQGEMKTACKAGKFMTECTSTQSACK
ncbi:MAG: hypothetical protein ACKVP4_09590 [Hyphomicrobium sp.]